jgi:hypothetical protein
MYLSIFPYTVLQKLFASLLWQLDRVREIPVNESHPTNQQVLRYLRSNAEKRSKWAPDYYYTPHEMQAVSDLHEEFEKMGKHLPQPCIGISYGYPVLVYPEGGVVFALAYNTDIIALRLPPTVRREALGTDIATDVLHIPGGAGYPDATIAASELGDDWVFTFLWGKHDDRIQELMRTAYDYASELA